MKKVVIPVLSLVVVAVIVFGCLYAFQARSDAERRRQTAENLNAATNQYTESEKQQAANFEEKRRLNERAANFNKQLQRATQK